MMRSLRGAGTLTRPGAVIAAAAVGALVVGLGSAYGNTPVHPVALGQPGTPAEIAMPVAHIVLGRVTLVAATPAVSVHHPPVHRRHRGGYSVSGLRPAPDPTPDPTPDVDPYSGLAWPGEDG
jgi:hypothetical protein